MGYNYANDLLKTFAYLVDQLSSIGKVAMMKPVHIAVVDLGEGEVYYFKRLYRL